MAIMSEDLDNLLKLFDYALSSDNPAVKKALKNLLLVVSIVEPQEDATRPGPLAEIKRELQRLQADINILQNAVRSAITTPRSGGYPYYPNTSGGTWTSTTPWVTSTTGSSGTGNIGAIGPSGTPIWSSNAYDDAKYSQMLDYIGSMLIDDESRFNKKDIT
jgi:hypothetical protein